MIQYVARNLRQLRRDRNLTQAEVARRVGIRQPEVSLLERGLCPPLALVDRLAAALGVAPAQLLRARRPRRVKGMAAR